VEEEESLEVTDQEYPYVFTTGRLIFHYHSGTMSRKTRRLHQEVPVGFVAINTQDALEQGIRDGDRVKLESRRGAIQALAKVPDETRRQVLFMPWHFGESTPNLLTGPTAGPPSKMPELKFCAVKMEAV